MKGQYDADEYEAIEDEMPGVTAAANRFAGNRIDLAARLHATRGGDEGAKAIEQAQREQSALFDAFITGALWAKKEPSDER